MTSQTLYRVDNSYGLALSGMVLEISKDSIPDLLRAKAITPVSTQELRVNSNWIAYRDPAYIEMLSFAGLGIVRVPIVGLRLNDASIEIIRTDDTTFICANCLQDAPYASIVRPAGFFCSACRREIGHHRPGSLHLARLREATPGWINWEAVKKICTEAQRLTRETGILHHVDHIVPIFGVDALGRHIVRGLHWEGNLQILTATENMKKHNRFVQSFERSGEVL